MINAAIVPEWKGKPNPLTKKISDLPKRLMIIGKIPLKTTAKMKSVTKLAMIKLFHVNS